MSNKVVEDMVLPVVIKLLRKHYSVDHSDPYHDTVYRDEALIQFFARELVKRLQIAGEPGGQCKFMKRQLEELRKRSPEKFELMIKEILDLYINLRTMTTSQAINEELGDHPPSPYFKPFRAKRKKKQRKPREMVPVV